MNTLTKNLLAMSVSAFTTVTSYASEQKITADESGLFGNLRVGYISSEDDAGKSRDSSAIGGKLGYVSTTWNNLSAGGTLYATQKLFNDDNGDFFDANGDSYAILGEAFIKANFKQTEFTAGRFEFDSPYADTDDIRMVPNTFSGAIVSNTDISDTTLYAAYLDQWSGVDSDEPEDFTSLNGGDGLYAVGVVFEGIESLALQGWLYQGSDLFQLTYAEAIYEFGDLVIGTQLASQSDKTSDNSGPDGDVYGAMTSYTIDDFIFSGAYNHVSGVVTNGFGGGPFFTSAADHTIADIEDQKALAIGAEYNGIEQLTLGLLHVDFDKGANETDVIIAYEFSDGINIETEYQHMYDDGKVFLVRFNVGF